VGRPEGGVFEAIQGFIVDEIGRYGYAAVFVLMVLESACIPIPSEVTMLFGGALASPAFSGSGRELDLVLVSLTGAVANLVGSWLAYWVGSVGGLPLARRWGRYLLVRPHEIDRAHEWFERHGEAAVFFSRLLPVIRTFISLPAGVARMPFGRFSVYTLLGCVPWTFALAGIGYVLGENWAAAERVLRPISWLVALALAALAASWVVHRVRRIRAEAPDRD
jgi:membrane protein DedA with SNARE-associated domain